jgi:TIR domain
VILVRVDGCRIPVEWLYQLQAEQTFDVLGERFTEDADRLAGFLNEKLSRRLVFVSHSHKDKGIVDKIVANLQESPEIELWYDSTALQPGSVLRRGIEAGIARAHYLLAILSQNAIDRIDGWIGFELDQAYEKERERNLLFGHHFVIPVLVEKNIKIPGWLSTKVWVDLTEDFETRLGELRRSLCRPLPKGLPWEK